MGGVESATAAIAGAIVCAQQSSVAAALDAATKPPLVWVSSRQTFLPKDEAEKLLAYKGPRQDAQSESGLRIHNTGTRRQGRFRHQK